MNIRGSLISRLIYKFLGQIKKTRQEEYLFAVSTLFYFLLWVLNPGNKIIAAAFVALACLIYLRFKDLRLSLLLTFLASSIIYSGKRYTIELVPPGIFDPVLFPNGYTLYLTITPGHIIASFMVLVWVRDFLASKISTKKIFSRLNLLLLLFLATILISDLFASKQSGLSLLFSLVGLNGFILYFYLQAYVKNLNKFLILLAALFSSFVIFESAISFHQYLSKSPLNKNLESQVEIERWGYASDELEFSFRPLGTFLHANSLAADLVFWLTLIFLAFIKTKDRRLLYVFIIGTGALVMTLSRSAWLAFVASSLTALFIIEKVKKKEIIPLFWNKKMLWLIAILPILFYFFILPRAQKSIYSLTEGGGSFRLELIGPTLEIIQENPILGIGRRMLVLEGLDFAPESIYGNVAYEVHNWYL